MNWRPLILFLAAGLLGGDVQYALEVRRGWFERHHIGNGTLARTEGGSLPETFLARRGLVR